MITLCVANHKGGVGKTASCHALGALLAESRRVLMCDVDPQASLTAACGVKDAAGRSVAEVIGGAIPGELALGDVLLKLGPNLWLAPSDLALATTELQLAGRIGRESVLRRALATVASDFELAILDTPPSLGLLNVNALVASTGVIIPTMPQAADLRGLALFMDSLERVRELNADLATVGVLVTFYDRRLTHHRQAIEAMESAGLPLFETRIGRSIRVAEAAAIGQSVVTYARRNPQAEAYRQLAGEVAAWADKNK